MQHHGRVAVIVALLLGVGAGAALAHGHRGNTNVGVAPLEVAPGESISVSFGYTIWHKDTIFPPNPWEVRLDGTVAQRDGILLAQGLCYQQYYNQWATCQVAVGVAIPADTAPGTHTVKIVTSADIDFASYVKYSYVDITVTSTTTAPVAEAGPDQTVEQESAAGTKVALDGSASVGAEVYEWREGEVVIGLGATCSKTLPLGAHSIVLTVWNSAGQSATDQLVVTVQDTTPPALTCPADMTVEQAGPDGARVGFACTATDVCDAQVEVTCTPPSGSVFAPGATTANCVATDDSGNTATGAFTVTVQDTTPPVLVCPEAISTEQGDPDGTLVEFEATATDVCDPDVEVTCAPPSGSVFPLGETEVTAAATDDAGNRATDTFPVTVGDSAAPEVAITSPEAKSYANTGEAIPIAYTVTDACDAEPEVTVTLDRQPAGEAVDPGALPCGEHTLTVVATDHSGNTGQASVTFSIEPQALPSFRLDEFRIHWRRGDDRFFIAGRFTLPEGMSADDLAAVALLTLNVAGQTATDRVVLRRRGVIWSYREGHHQDDSLGQGVDIDTMQIVFPPRRRAGDHTQSATALCNDGNRRGKGEAWFVVTGSLALPGLDVNSRPATGGVRLALPLSTSGGTGGLAGSQQVEFRVYKPARLWRYRD